MHLKFDVFGKQMSVCRNNGEWLLFLDSGTGLRSRIYDVVVPSDLAEAELAKYLGDIFHENAKASNSKVIKLD